MFPLWLVSQGNILSFLCLVKIFLLEGYNPLKNSDTNTRTHTPTAVKHNTPQAFYWMNEDERETFPEGLDRICVIENFVYWKPLRWLNINKETVNVL